MIRQPLRLRIPTLLTLLLCAVAGAWGETVKYSISNEGQLTITGTPPSGATASFIATGSRATRMTNGDSQTLTLSGFDGYVITKLTLAMMSNSSSGAGKLLYSTDNGESYTYLVGSSSQGLTFKNSAWYGSWHTTEVVDVIKYVNIKPTSNNLIIKIEATANSLYCNAYTIAYERPATVTLNSSGFATFASTSALDFTDAETNGYSAWQITGISGTDITFQQITGAVAAGTGVLLKGTASSSIEIPFATSAGDVLTGNKLEGVTTPTSVNDDEYYGLKGSEFVKVNAGTVPAGKALLKASDVPTEVKSLSFVFDDSADHIQGLTPDPSPEREGRNEEWSSTNVHQEIFSLSGQRLSQPQRGLNIIDGKKVVVK